jgi:hypothetical protein
VPPRDVLQDGLLDDFHPLFFVVAKLTRVLPKDFDGR